MIENIQRANFQMKDPVSLSFELVEGYRRENIEVNLPIL
jgi:hypothetical protein